MTNVMIDLETLGTSASAAIVQLGAVKFDPTDTVSVSVDTFERTISIDSNLRAGRTVDGSTIEWWLRQSGEARRSIVSGPVSLFMALYDFADWLGLPAEIEGLWSHGAAFDVAILEDAYRGSTRAAPWDHRVVRDTRTMFWLAESLCGWERPTRETAHTALADAIAQAEDVRSAQAALSGRRP